MEWGGAPEGPALAEELVSSWAVDMAFSLFQQTRINHDDANFPYRALLGPYTLHIKSSWSKWKIQDTRGVG